VASIVPDLLSRSGVSIIAAARLIEFIEHEVVRLVARSSDVVDVVVVTVSETIDITDHIVTVGDVGSFVVVLVALDAMEHSDLSVHEPQIEATTEVGEIISLDLIVVALARGSPHESLGNVIGLSEIRTVEVDLRNVALAVVGRAASLNSADEVAVKGEVHQTVHGRIVAEDTDNDRKIAGINVLLSQVIKTIASNGKQSDNSNTNLAVHLKRSKTPGPSNHNNKR